MSKPSAYPEDAAGRPPVWIGHVVLPSTDVPGTTAFLVSAGMRVIVEQPALAVLELRGGTHLVVLPAEAPIAPDAQAPFDLMYEDVDAIWKHCREHGLDPTPIQDGQIHRSFTVVEPGGHAITVNSTHASDHPV